MDVEVDLRRSRLELKEWHIYLLYACVIIAIFAPVILQDYAFTDDYVSLGNSILGGTSTFEWDILSGRPIYAILRDITQGYLTDIGDFSLIRAFTVVSTIIFCIFIRLFLVNRQITSNHILLFFAPIFLSLAPAIVVYVSWASCYPYVLSLILSGMAYSLLVHKSGSISNLRFILSALTLIAAFLIYQPTGMAFLFYVFLDNCVSEKKLNIRVLVSSFFVLLFSMIVGLLAAKILPKLMFGFVLDRTEITDSLTSKLGWFFNEVLLNVINNFNINPNPIYTAISIFIVFLGIFSLSRKNQGALKVLLGVVLMIGSFLPGLLVEESWASFRISIGMELIIITVMLIGLAFVMQKLTINFSFILFGIILFAVSIYTQDNIYKGFIRQQQGEYQTLAQQISNQVDKDFTGKIRFDTSEPAFNIFTHVQRYDEFGNITMATDWSMRGMAASIKAKKGFQYQIDGDMILKPDEKCESDCIVINTGDAMRMADGDH